MRLAVARNGVAQIEEWDLPELGAHQLLIKTEYSAISTGTELMIIRGRGNGTRLGYNAVGIVVDKGAGVDQFEIGQRVACYGGPAHANYRISSKYLATAVPDHVDPEEAAFVGLGTIAIHALRQSDLRFGEMCVIAGLGILGQIIAQIAEASAFRVIGHDILRERCDIMRSAAKTAIVCEDVEEIPLSVGRGADSVLICGGGKDDDLLNKGISWLRDRGNIVIVGVPNTSSFNRNALFHKEAQIRITRAGGPGRYDPNYEVEGFDYPEGFVRWTEGRNVEQFVHMLSENRISMKPLISHRFDIANILDAYQLCLESPEKTLGIVIKH